MRAEWILAGHQRHLGFSAFRQLPDSSRASFD
jgi:hypothetical protein